MVMNKIIWIALLCLSSHANANRYIERDYDIYGSPDNSGLAYLFLIVIIFLFLISDWNGKKEMIGFFFRIALLLAPAPIVGYLSVQVSLYFTGKEMSWLGVAFFVVVFFGGLYLYSKYSFNKLENKKNEKKEI